MVGLDWPDMMLLVGTDMILLMEGRLYDVGVEVEE